MILGADRELTKIQAAKLGELGPQTWLIEEMGELLPPIGGFAAETTASLQKLLEYLDQLNFGDDALKKLKNRKKDQGETSLILSPVLIQPNQAQHPDIATIPWVDWTFTLPPRGVPAALEWWHFETSLRHEASWHDFAESIGYHAEVLEAPAADKALSPPGFVGGAGLARRFNRHGDATMAGAIATLPTNFSDIPEGG
jgi:hypothetical protein